MMNSNGEIIYDLLIAFFSVSFVVLAVILVVLCLKNSKPGSSEEEANDSNTITSSGRSLVPALPYALAYVDAATDSFNPNRVIGNGRLGVVYAGVLPNGDAVAVKRIHPRLVWSSNSTTTSNSAFARTLKSLSRANHPNVVKIVGFSEAPGERVILMEFIGMVDLSFYLHGSSENASSLGWDKRLKIVAGVARGLEYLHEKMSPNVVHGCIKASNVLIDAMFCARICDYGLSFLTSNGKKGASGHIGDEHWLDHHHHQKRVACKENDVYGFGVILIEILSGRICDERGMLVRWAIPLIKEMRYYEFLDPRAGIPSDMKPLARLAKVALACVANSRQHRPSIVHVASILNDLTLSRYYIDLR